MSKPWEEEEWREEAAEEEVVCSVSLSRERGNMQSMKLLADRLMGGREVREDRPLSLRPNYEEGEGQ